jgi:hypothetical protein
MPACLLEVGAHGNVRLTSPPQIGIKGVCVYAKVCVCVRLSNSRPLNPQPSTQPSTLTLNVRSRHVLHNGDLLRGRLPRSNESVPLVVATF